MKIRKLANKVAGFIYKLLWLSMTMVCSYYAGQLDQLDGTLTPQVLTDHLYNTIITSYGGSVFEAIVWIFWMLAIGCWIRALRTNDKIDSCEVAITVIAVILTIAGCFLPKSTNEFWNGNRPYTVLVIDLFVLFGNFYHCAWGAVTFILSIANESKEEVDDDNNNDGDNNEDSAPSDGEKQD